MLCETAMIFISMLAAIGICELAICIYCAIFSKRLRGRMHIVVDNLDENDAERVIRGLETVLALTGLCGFAFKIRLSESVRLDEGVLERLKREYGNIEEEELGKRS